MNEAIKYLDDEAIYQTAPFRTLKKAVEIARKIYSSANPTSATVTAQLSILTEAISNLEKVENSKLYAPGEMAIAGQPMIGDTGNYYLDFQSEFDGTDLDADLWLDQYLPHWTSNKSKSNARYELRDGKLVLKINKEDKPWSENDGKVIVSGITTYNRNYLHDFTGNNTLYEHPDSTKTDNNFFDGYTTKYGYIEMRAKLKNDGGGGHQVLWLVGTQSDTEDWANSKQTAKIDLLETSYYDAYTNWRNHRNRSTKLYS